MSLTLVGGNALVVLALMTGLWAVSVRLRDASIVDPWWSIGFLFVALRTVAQTGATPGKLLLLVQVTAWALRLFVYLLWRSRGKPEDPRYAAFRRRYGPKRYWWVSFFQVFLLQGTLVLVISAPLQAAGSEAAPDPVSLTDLLGLVVFSAGLAIEIVADAQLAAFRRARARRGPEAGEQILASGLWRFSRHPNYFGEALLWWGLWLSAVGEPLGWATVLAPALMTFLLVKVSGVAMLDAHLLATRPAYAEYLRRTSAFVPRPPCG
jgi:steroid 5-alpha reductase family enzyme